MKPTPPSAPPSSPLRATLPPPSLYLPCTFLSSGAPGGADEAHTAKRPSQINPEGEVLERVVVAAASALLEATGRIDELDGKVRMCKWGLQERRGEREGGRVRSGRHGGETQGRASLCGAGTA